MIQYEAQWRISIRMCPGVISRSFRFRRCSAISSVGTGAEEPTTKRLDFVANSLSLAVTRDRNVSGNSD